MTMRNHLQSPQRSFWSQLRILLTAGIGRKLFAHQNTKHHGEAGSLHSSGLRREVQDSLSELEQLIEQQHRQV